MTRFGEELTQQGDLMDEVCAHLTNTLQQQLETHWKTLLNPTFAALISGSKLQPVELQTFQADWWERVRPHVEAWSKRQAGRLARKLSRKKQAEETIWESDIGPVIEKLRHAVRQLILVQTLIDGKLNPSQEKRIREELWLELAPQVERTAMCYQKSAAKRGFEVEDLIQDASAHFQQVITRFNPQDSRQAMLGTWFDDVIDNLFAAAVRPRKSDPLKRGLGGTAEEETSEEFSTSPKQTIRYVRDYRRQKEVEDSLKHIDEVCSQLVETGICPFERVLAFNLYVREGLTYQQVAEALKTRGYQYGTTQMFNFVKEVKAHVQHRFEGDSFTGLVKGQGPEE